MLDTIQRPLLKKNAPQVFLQNFQLSAKRYMKVGQDVPKKVPYFQRVSLWKRGLIGEKGHPWTKRIVELRKEDYVRSKHNS